MLKSLPATGDVSETVTQLVKLDAELCQSANPQNSTDDTEQLQTFLEDLLLDMKAEDWIFAVNRVLPSTLQIRPEETAVVTGRDSIKRCFELIVESGLKRAATYLATSLDAEVAGLEREKQLVENYDHLIIRFCLGLSQRTVTMTWLSIVAEFVAKAEDGATVVRGMFRELQSANYGSTSFWLRDDSRERAAEVFQETSLAIGIYDSTAAESAADYSDFRPSFGAMRIFISRFLETLRHNQEVRLRTPPTRTELVLASVDPFGDVGYVPSLKTVLLPAVFLTEPYLYSKGVPLYFNYGIVGSLLASGLAKAVMDAQGLEPDRQGSTERRRKLERNVTLACLRRLHNKLGFKQNVSGTPEEQDVAMYALAQGALLAHASLAADLKALAMDQEEYASVWPEAQTTFFLRFCLWSCSGTQHPSPLSPKERCLLPLHNMPAFASTFGCENRKDFFKSHCSF
ncbi:hypothetical protein V5799_026976 [Amblyomma americanum]|uniref:Uncharacterized protein n=1 Tax=Amblyomma americanum TaxID=6943 RepID=A0AAQ4DH15_AMBAM